MITLKVKNLNASSKKTKNLIKETFAILMNEKKELNNITVTELVNKANITRATFYTHYDNIYDVAKDFQNETLELLSKNSKNLHSIDDVNDYFDNIFKYLKENENTYKMILSSNDPLLFTDKLTKLIKSKLYNHLKIYNKKDLNLSITFFIDGCIILIIKHFRGEIDNSLDEINEYMKKMFKVILIN